MENKNTLLIIIVVLVIALVGLFVFLNLTPTEQQQAEQNNQQQAEQNNQQEKVNPVVKQSLDIRKTTEMISGQLYEVGDASFVIEQSILEEGQDMSDPEAEPKYTQEYIKVNITPATEIFDLSDIKYITVPSNITGVIDTLNYLSNYSDEYAVNIFIAAGAPVVNGEIETNYIEWSSWPKGGF